jgi:hypothetical protein
MKIFLSSVETGDPLHLLNGDPCLEDPNLQQCRVFCLLLFEAIFTSFFNNKRSLRSHKTVGINVLLSIFAWWQKDPDPYRTSYGEWIRTREAQNTDPTDSDPQHCFNVVCFECFLNLIKAVFTGSALIKMRQLYTTSGSRKKVNSHI